MDAERVRAQCLTSCSASRFVGLLKALPYNSHCIIEKHEVFSHSRPKKQDFLTSSQASFASSQDTL